MKKRKKRQIDARSKKRVNQVKRRQKKEDNVYYNQSTKILRIKSGVKGFDSLIDGGIPKNFLVLLSGGPGTGKTTFAAEFLIEGALNGENGIYLSLEEDPVKTEKQMEQFGFPIKQLEKENKLKVIRPTLYDFTKLKEILQETVLHFKAKRLVIDSISLLRLYFKDAFTVRRALLDIEATLRETDCTTLVVSESQKNIGSLSPFGVEEFISDGIILLYLVQQKGEFRRGIAVRKMRLTNHSLKIHPVTITRNGGLIVEKRKEFSLDDN